MTTELLNISTLSTVSVNVSKFGTDLIHADTTINPLKGSSESFYVLVGQDDDHPLDARIGKYTNGGTSVRTNLSVKVNSFTKETEGDVVTYDPCSVVIATSFKGRAGMPTDKGEFLQLVLASASLLFNTATAGVPDEVIAAKLASGITQIR